MADGKITIKVVADTAKAIAGLDEVRDVGSKMGKSIGSAAKLGARAAVTAVTAAGAAAGTTLAGITKQALDAYATYEQAVGGVETLFGKSSDIVMENAARAYETAGLSANDYMNQVTSFAASLLQSLGGDTEKAAQYSDRAVADMADNANKMGTDMASIQNAYQGFAKQNYTMLDNLKLGYGGTKEEMERLVKDASKMTGIQKELGVSVDGASLSFGNIVNAISVVQKKLKITGTTSKEASDTIEGSANSARAAWTNWVTGLGDDAANMDELTEQLVESLTTAAENIVPRIGEIVGALAGYGPDAVENLVDAIQGEASKVDVQQTGADILNALADAIRNADISGNASRILDDIQAALSGQASSPMAQAGADLADALIEEFTDIVSDPGNWAAAATSIGSIVNSLVDSLWNKTIGKISGWQLNDGQVSTNSSRKKSFVGPVIKGSGTDKGGFGGSKRGHAVGGVFDTMTALGSRDVVGEGGMELVQPLNKATYEMMGAGIAAHLGGQALDYDRLAAAVSKSVEGIALYVGKDALARSVRAEGDKAAGRAAILARRGVDR